jgi:DNA-binding LacI/PurR family transcriptional regulator
MIPTAPGPLVSLVGDTGRAMGKVTLQSIADRVGVSRMTVSNAFSRPDQLSADLREKILAAAEELGYVGPDPAARALARGRVGSIGLLLTDRLGEAFQDAVATEFLAAVADGLAAEGLALTLITADAGAGFVPARDVALDGALIYLCDPVSADVGWLDKRGLPIVTVDQYPRPGVPSVNVDDRGGATAAAEHLLGLGHRSIGVVTIAESALPGEPGRQHPGQERLRGWTGALIDAGVEASVVSVPFRPATAAFDAARQLLERPDRPTAVLCFSDAFATEVVRAAESLGLRIPDDLSVVGFDDSPLAAASRPPLTTVRQDVTAKGREAVRAVVAALRGDATDEQLLLPTELVVRGSTAPPPG